MILVFNANSVDPDQMLYSAGSDLGLELWNASKYPYIDISDLQNWGKYKSDNHISQMNI